MPLQPTQSEVVNFVLGISPSTNPYRATANHISEFLKPCSLPRWSQYVEHFFGVIYLIDMFFAGYIIYLRLKTTKFHLVRFNTLGLIQLDRGFHCTSWYMIHAAVAVSELIFRDFIFADHADQTWSNLITGIKSTLLLCNAWVFLWMCVCHCALVRWGPIGNPNKSSYAIPYNMARVLNFYFLSMLIWTIVPIFWSFSHLTMEYIFVSKLAKHTIHRLLHASISYSPSTYSPVKIFTMLIPMQTALTHVSTMAHYTRLGSTFYLINTFMLATTYLPFLALIMKDFHRRGSTGILLRKQEQVLMQGILHTTMSFLSFPILGYMLHFRGVTFIYDPTYWIVLRVGLHGSMAISECVALYLLWCTMNISDVLPTSTASHMVILKTTSEKQEA